MPIDLVAKQVGSGTIGGDAFVEGDDKHRGH